MITISMAICEEVLVQITPGPSCPDGFVFFERLTDPSEEELQSSLQRATEYANKNKDKVKQAQCELY